jgi:hypothetical protein
MKYILFEGPTGFQPVIFPDAMVHAAVNESLRRGLWQTQGLSLTPMSAGFISIAPIVTHGNSESMNLSSNPRDVIRVATHDVLAPGMKLDWEILQKLKQKMIEQLQDSEW